MGPTFENLREYKMITKMYFQIIFYVYKNKAQNTKKETVVESKLLALCQ